MSDENVGAETPNANEGGAHADDMVPKSEFTKVIGQRQDLKAKIREYEARFAQEESAKAEAQEAALRQQGENEKIIAARDEQLASVTAELEQLKWGQRFKNTAAAVSAKAGIDQGLAEALLLREKHVSGADVALEELSDEVVTELAKTLRSSNPSLFQTSGKGGSPSVPGLNEANKAPGEAGGRGKYFAMGQQMSAHNRKG